MNSLYHAFLQYKFTLIITSAFILDLIFGDPIYRLHPVRIIGKIIDFFYKLLKEISVSKRFLSIIIVFLVISVLEVCYIALCHMVGSLRIILDIFLCYSFIALKDLFVHIQPVINSLNKGDIKSARAYLSKIVGRDTKKLNKNGIIRACIETIAEGFVDGFLSPVFWFFVGSLFGTPIIFMLLYKITNTLDSMLGYKSPEFIDIGFASARLDDIMNFIPARISIIVLFIGALILRLNAKRAFLIALRDRLKHTSPNSAHPEAFVAGALGIRLGGPTYYPYGLVEKPWIGNDEKEPDIDDIKKSIRLIKASAFITIFCSFCLTPQ